MFDTCRQVVSGNLRTDSGTLFDPNIRDIATAFIELQENRHEADYDPFAKIALSEAKTAVAKATAAIQILDNSPYDERCLFLTLLQFKLRS
jgi:hypothetical protein